MKRLKISAIILTTVIATSTIVDGVIAHAEPIKITNSYNQKTLSNLDKGFAKDRIAVKNLNGKIIGYTNKFDMLEIIRRTNDSSAEVLTQYGLKGYIPTDKLTSIKSGVNDKLLKLDKKGHVTNVTTVLNLRKEPQIGSEILNKLTNNTKIDIIGKQGDWYKVSIGNMSGYVYNEFINEGVIKKNLVNVREELTKENKKVIKPETSREKKPVVKTNSNVESNIQPESKTSYKPEEKPNKPENKPSKPENKLEQKPNKPEQKPEQKPSKPEEKPSKPEEKPSKPEQKPEEKPSKPEEKPSKPEEKPEQPSGVSYASFKSSLPGLGFKHTVGTTYEYGDCGGVRVTGNGAYFGLADNTPAFANATRSALSMLIPSGAGKAYSLATQGASASFNSDGRHVNVYPGGSEVYIEIEG